MSFPNRRRNTFVTAVAFLLGAAAGATFLPFASAAPSRPIPDYSLQERVADLEAIVEEMAIALDILHERVVHLEDAGGGGECEPDGKACQTAEGQPGLIVSCQCVPFAEPTPVE
jgi:hypothetical protein